MEYLIPLLLVFLVLIFVLPLVAMSRAGNAQRRVNDLTRKIEVLQNRINVLASTIGESRRQPPQAAWPAVELAEEPRRTCRPRGIHRPKRRVAWRNNTLRRRPSLRRPPPPRFRGNMFLKTPGSKLPRTHRLHRPFWRLFRRGSRL